MSRRKSKIPQSDSGKRHLEPPSSSKPSEKAAPSELKVSADVASVAHAKQSPKPRRQEHIHWHSLNVMGRDSQPGETRRRYFAAAVLICVLPFLCGLLLLPFFYRKSNAATVSTTVLAGSQIYSLPEYEEVLASNGDVAWYEWMRLADPRQCLLPDSRAGFSRFNHFQPHYAAAAFPQYQTAKMTRQPLYHELFALISPQSPRTLANEQVNLLWQRHYSLMPNELPLQLKPSVQRPVWRLADGTPLIESEAPILPADALEYWKDENTQKRLAEHLRNSFSEMNGQTVLELRVPPGVTLPRMSSQESRDWEPPLVVPRVVLRRSCGDARLDHAAVVALRNLLEQRSSAIQTASPGNHLLLVDWTCW